MNLGELVGTIHVSANGKRNLAVDFAVIDAFLRAQERGLEVCASCGDRAVETLAFWHPYIPDVGLCRRHLTDWRLDHLLEF